MDLDEKGMEFSVHTALRTLEVRYHFLAADHLSPSDATIMTPLTLPSAPPAVTYFYSQVLDPNRPLLTLPSKQIVEMKLISLFLRL
jgi:hypothetical protein